MRLFNTFIECRHRYLLTQVIEKKIKVTKIVDCGLVMLLKAYMQNEYNILQFSVGFDRPKLVRPYDVFSIPLKKSMCSLLFLQSILVTER